MSYRFLAFALMALLAVGALQFALSGSAYAQQDDLWYPGEGIQQNTYYTYSIREIDTNNDQPYEMTMYFQEQQDGDWIVPTFVIDDDGSVIQGTMKLSDSMAYLAGGSQVPPEMNDYIGGYSSSLHWLDAFTTKANPLSLNAASWGRIACIGCAEIKPTGSETITVAGESVDTRIVGWTRGQEVNNIWIQNEFPFPVKALTHADVTTGSAPILFEFELLETGTGQPVTPNGTSTVPTPPLSKTTDRGQYRITLDWEPVEIKPETPVIFTVSLTDESGFPLERANYDFVITNSTGGIIQEFNNQNADAEFGTGTHEVVFESAGGFTATATINSVSGQTTGGFTESADFNMVVVPEFPVSAAIVAAAVIGLVVLVTRAKGAGVGSLFGGKGAL